MRPKWVLLVLFAAAIALSWMAVRRSEQAAASFVNAAGQTSSQRAFSKALWGMTPSQVARVNGAALKPVSSSDQFYRAEDSDRSQYLSYQQEGARYLGRDAVITYTFRDRRLFAYHAMVSDTNGEVLDADVRRYLAQLFGKDSSSQEDSSTLKLIWHFKDLIVNYWFMENDLVLRPKYTAVIGVTSQT